MPVRLRARGVRRVVVGTSSASVGQLAYYQKAGFRLRRVSNVYLDMGKYDLWLEEWKKAGTLSGDHEDLAVAEEAARFVAYLTSPAADQLLIEEASQLPYRRGLSGDPRFARSLRRWPTLSTPARSRTFCSMRSVTTLA